MPPPAPPAPPTPAAGAEPRRRSGAALRYGAALALTAAALLVSLALREWLAPNVFIFFFAAVVVAAWHGGRGPALLATVLAVPLASYFFLHPVHTLKASPADALRLAVFAGIAVLIGAMRESLGRAAAQAEEARREAERVAFQLQEQAAELEMQTVELEQQKEEAQALAEELEEAQAILTASMERQLADAQAMAHVGSWEWIVPEDHVRWSDEMHRIYGLEPGARIGLETFLERVHPEDRERVSAAVRASLESGEPFDFEHRIVRPDGAVRTLHARGRVDRAADGRPVRMSGTGQDVTDERAAQDAARELAAARAARAAAEEGRRRLEAVLEGIGEAFVAFDGEWRYTMLNTRAVEAIGRPREEVLGRSVWELFPESVGGEAWREMHRVRAEGRPASVELRSALLGRWLAMHVAPWEDGLSVFYEDVTERREAQETRARLAAIVESSGDAIFSKTLEGIVTSWNRGAERLYGYTAAEMIGRPVALLAPPERVDEIPAILRRISRGERVDTFETVRRRKDGTLVDVLLAVSPIADAAGEVVGASTIARDVTERKRTEARLRESEESLRFLAEASRVLASSLDLRGTLAAVLRLGIPRLGDFCSMYLVDEEGRARAVGSAHADPDREPLLAELVSGFTPHAGGETPVSRVLSTGEAVLIPEVDETALEAAVEDDEARRRLHALAARSILAVPLKSDGRTVGVMSFAMGDSGRRHSPADLALAEEVARRAAVAVENARLHGAEREARRAAEAAAARTARLQAVTAALSEARTPADVADVVIREGFTSLGAAAGWLMELDAAGEMLEVLRSAGYGDDVVARFRAFPLDTPVPLADAVRTGEPVFLESPEARALRYPALSRDFDGLGYGAWISVPLVVEGKAVGGIGLTFARPRAFDAEQREFVAALARQCAMALERARLFEAERRARTEAEAANRAKFTFLTTMSHELRTPLNAIAGYVELLELEIRGPLNEAQHEYLAKVRRSQTHLLGLINDVLNFARIETGHVHFDLGDVPLDETLAEIETLIAPQVQARGLAYEYRRYDAGCTVRADVEKLRQIVLNLLSNAVKFTPAGGRIVMECGPGADGMVEVRVRDTGVGIPADKLATIFEPFVQVNSGYTRPNEGTGLGLSISRDLARAMGGDLLVESRDSEGSVFTLTLPPGGAASADDGDALAAETRTA